MKILEQYRCGKTVHKDGIYEVLGHNFTETVQWKVFSYADKEADIPRHWKVVVKCKYCGKKKTVYCHNLEVRN